MAEKSPPKRVRVLHPGVAIRDVWADQAEQELEELCRWVEYYPLVAMDSEFARREDLRSSTTEPRTADAHYTQMCGYVNGGELVQVGFAICDPLFVVPDATSAAWQFNLRFDASARPPNSASVSFLRDKAHLDLQAHASHRAIPVDLFLLMIRSSSLMSNPKITWITFHGSTDFGYLLRCISGAPDLPPNRHTFMEQFRQAFPKAYDIKIFSQHGNCLQQKIPGGLNTLANALGVQRQGEQHQAGSDALVSLRCFAVLMEKLPSFAHSICHFNGVLYGVSDPPSAAACRNSANTLSRADYGVFVVHLGSRNFDAFFGQIASLFPNCCKVAVELATAFEIRLSHFSHARQDVKGTGDVELALAISDSRGRVAYGRVWVFHLQGKDPAGNLSATGLHNEEWGPPINPAQLAQLLTQSSGILDPRVDWASSSAAAFVYLVKALTAADSLPCTRSSFMALCTTFFPSLFELHLGHPSGNLACCALMTLRNLLTGGSSMVKKGHCSAAASGRIKSTRTTLHRFGFSLEVKMLTIMLKLKLMSTCCRAARVFHGNN
uniref:Uncharacterized protein n=1 Tax=Oryza punctata TaxID=4537 RepID=A0A0E0L5X5_ORYPU